MSSLQRRVRESSSWTNARDEPSNNKKASFENCFANGLDISEFTAVTQPTHSAAAELMKIKRNEQNEEMELEKRIAEVHATTLQKSSPTYELSLRAVNPHSNRIGSERENNFLQFENGSNRTDNGFISSLLQSHDSEKKEYKMSQRSLSKSKIVARCRSDKMTGVARGAKKKCSRSMKSGSGNRVSAKKTCKTKF